MGNGLYPRHRIFESQDDEEENFEDEDFDDEEDEYLEYNERLARGENETEYQMMQFEEIAPYEGEDLERNPVEESDDDLDDHDSGSVYEEENEEQWNQDEVDLL